MSEILYMRIYKIFHIKQRVRQTRTRTQNFYYSRIVALGPFGHVQQPVLAVLQTQINTTTLPADVISTSKQLTNAVSQVRQMCRNIRLKFLSWA